MTMADAIATKLKDALSPRHIEVLDVSYKHAGHAGWREGGETHFEVTMTADAFAGKSRVECHRMVNHPRRRTGQQRSRAAAEAVLLTRVV